MMPKYLSLLILYILSGSLYAQSETFEGLMNRLLAPGPMITPHADLEHKDCLKCHEPGGGVPNNKCLDCHTEIDKQVDIHKSFHGLMTNKPCIECHKEHKGRDYDSTKVNTKTFDHNLTGFKLDGKHVKVACEKCHTKDRNDRGVRKGDPIFFGTSSSCKSCHAKDDIHFFKSKKFMNMECSQCHTSETWKNTSNFDHQKETGFALVGKHATLQCSDCHTKQGNQVKYEWPNFKTQGCLSCHADQHGQNLSPKFQNGRCETCHVQNTWDISTFNHAVTGFALKGDHAHVDCIDCHKQPTPRLSPGNKQFNFKMSSKECSSCHTDFHGFNNKTSSKFGSLMNCESCHNEIDWKHLLKFNHDTDTRFPIQGKHKENTCFDCHKPLSKGRPAPNTPRRYSFPELTTKTCETCHKSPHSQDFHNQFKGMTCANCHVPEGWDMLEQSKFGATSGSFHDKTRFPLTGKHKTEKCQTCHVRGGKEIFKFPNFEKNFCVDCHANVHEKQFHKNTANKACSECHNTDSFSRRLPFNHNETAFKLTGDHLKIGLQCEKCHVETRAKLPTKPPKTAHKFVFEGARKGFCESCHTNVHKRQFHANFSNKPCAACHTTDDFLPIKHFNHNSTRFKLTGKHAQIERQCSECHVKSKLKIPTDPPKLGHKFIFSMSKGEFCTECHVNDHKDMFHRQFYNKPCTDCHITKAFADLKPFDHDETSFALKGKHIKVKCEECHQETKKRYHEFPKVFKGDFLFPEIARRDCATCHKDPHKGSFGKDCSSCHTESGWKLADDFHKNFTLTGPHLLLSCAECHTNNRMLMGSSEECQVCHNKDDPHHGALLPCQSCHTQTFWQHLKFDHNMTAFPLQGVHRLTDCASCHNKGIYEGTPTECVACHITDAAKATAPVHTGDRFEQCQQCHNQFTF
jgi:hypothetical protein